MHFAMLTHRLGPRFLGRKGQLLVFQAAPVRSRATGHRAFFQSRFVLMASTGMANRRIARELNTSRPTVILWRQRFLQGGPAALDDIPGRGRWPQRKESVRQLCSASGMRAQLKPHRTKRFKLSRDKCLVEKLTNVVGLYLNPPDKA
jgi:hypothetical protein